MTQQVASIRRKSARSPVKKMIKDDDYDAVEEEQVDDYDGGKDQWSEESDIESRPKKRSKAESKSKDTSSRAILDLFKTKGEISTKACIPPLRRHKLSYHRPLLLCGEQESETRESLLTWFDSVSTSRSMPWRKEWVNPDKFQDKQILREILKKRAYEVWISEIMLQQTRVSTVIDYWTKWIEKWPTIEDLAKADSDQVLSAWRGLGYYSRATRIHTAAQKVVQDKEMKGLLPESAELLQKNVPGVGRYTGGAISSIVFGKAAAMVDGNVLRVLSRQLGIYGDVKGSKKVIDLLWNAADALVKEVAKDEAGNSEKKSDRPGRWGQALMELGSTICSPNPICRSCPITATCRTYAEGRLLSVKEEGISDIEDLCTICEPFEDADALDGELEVKPEKSKRNGKQSTLSSFAFNAKDSTKKQDSFAKLNKDDAKVIKTIERHCKKFPMKVSKKAVREEEIIVCAIRNEKKEYLLHQRPDKGLLAGLWELPSSTLPASNDSKKAARIAQANEYVGSLVQSQDDITHLGEVGVIPWLFSHLRLTMHVHLFQVKSNGEIHGRWASRDQVEEESIGTGMRKCWTLVKDL